MTAKRLLLPSLFAALFAAQAAELPLNGSWEFRFEEDKALVEVADPAFAATDAMSVPGCWDMQPQWLCLRGTALYRRKFTLDAPVSNAWLVVDGMGLTGKFMVDGRDLGTHPFPYARLEMETGALAAGEHVVFAALDNRFDWTTQKLARPYYDFYCFGGFYHGVSLSFDNRRLLVRTRDFRTGTVEIEAVNFHERDFSAPLLFDGKRSVEAAFRNSRATVQVPNFKLWSPESPNLHVVSLDGCRARFGVREIKADKRKLWLNGKPLYLKGANRHESHPTFGAATPEALMVADLQNLKSIGGNFFRGCHYQQSQRFLDYCDEMGVLVWEESLGWGNGSHSPMAKGELSDPGFIRDQIAETRAMVRASFNHPSVIIFAYMNEFLSGSKDGKALSDKLIDVIRAEDSGRLVTFACSHLKDDICNDRTDLVAFNTYPGWIGPGEPTRTGLPKLMKWDVDRIVKMFRERYPEKPIIVSEMGACGVYGHHDPAGAQWTEEFQAEYDEAVINAVFGNAEICGLTLWQFTDSRSHHRSGAPVRGKPFAENLAGLYDAYRRPKLSAAAVSRLFKAK